VYWFLRYWWHRHLARIIGGQYYYYIYNGHGDVVQLIDQNGNIKNNYTYDEWGNINSKQEQVSNPLKYAGEYYDDESGLYYLRARYYDPTIGRFISKDSYEGKITNPLSLNLYTYCYNDPLGYVDPTGHDVWNRFGEKIGTAPGKDYTDYSPKATDTHGGGEQAKVAWNPRTSSSDTGSSTASGSSIIHTNLVAYENGTRLGGLQYYFNNTGSGGNNGISSSDSAGRILLAANTGAGNGIFSSKPYKWFERQNPYVQTVTAIPIAFAASGVTLVTIAGGVEVVAGEGLVGVSHSIVYSARVGENYVYLYAPAATKVIEYGTDAFGGSPPQTKPGIIYNFIKSVSGN